MLFWSSRIFVLGWPGLEHRLGAQGEGAESTVVETGGGSRWWGGDFVVGGKGEGKEKLREAGDEEMGWNKWNEKSQEKDLAIQLGATHLVPLVVSLCLQCFS